MLLLLVMYCESKTKTKDVQTIFLNKQNRRLHKHAMSTQYNSNAELSILVSNFSKNLGLNCNSISSLLQPN